MSGKLPLACFKPGHSFKNRNQSPDGSYREWEANQDICEKAHSILQRNPYIDSFVTKTACELSTLATEVQKAEDRKADIYLSQHTNGHITGQWSDRNGVTVYVYPGRTRSHKLASIGLKWSEALLPMNMRGVRTANLFEVRVPTMPAVLFETGYHTNREDVAKLKTQDFRWLQAEVLARTACEYLDVEYLEDDTMTPRHIVAAGDRLGRIAQAHNLTLDEILQYNPHITDANLIHPGDIVYLGPPSSVEIELAALTRELIMARKEIEFLTEQFARVKSALTIAEANLEKSRLTISDYESRLDKIHTTSKV